MFDKFVNLDFAVVAYCSGDKSSFWNHALTNQALNKNQLQKIEETMMNLDRKPAIYFENQQELQSLVNFLKKEEYKFDYEDSWMFHSGENIDKTKFDLVKKVTTKQDLNTLEGTYANEFYKRIGFITEFTAVCYKKTK